MTIIKMDFMNIFDKEDLVNSLEQLNFADGIYFHENYDDFINASTSACPEVITEKEIVDFFDNNSSKSQEKVNNIVTKKEKVNDIVIKKEKINDIIIKKEKIKSIIAVIKKKNKVLKKVKFYDDMSFKEQRCYHSRQFAIKKWLEKRKTRSFKAKKYYKKSCDAYSRKREGGRFVKSKINWIPITELQS
jgi:hypothetical protein